MARRHPVQFRAQPIDGIRQEALALCLQHDPGCAVVSEVVELGGD